MSNQERSKLPCFSDAEHKIVSGNWHSSKGRATQ
jgi:hypothetical protein